MFKCVVENCIEKANYNKKFCTNPAYCYLHKKKDMYKIGKYNSDDIIEIIFVNIENFLYKTKK